MRVNIKYTDKNEPKQFLSNGDLSVDSFGFPIELKIGKADGTNNVRDYNFTDWKKNLHGYCESDDGAVGIKIMKIASKAYLGEWKERNKEYYVEIHSREK
jgi:hypothetical protein